VAPTTGCDATHVDATARVDYSATYYFYTALALPKTGDPALPTTLLGFGGLAVVGLGVALRRWISPRKTGVRMDVSTG
jgi:LPXTG-motif cell wall-anchored protein